MGSPLSPTFANFYMGDLEQRIFTNNCNRPIKYARYVDDIFLQANNEDDIRTLKHIFEQESVLKFTIELSVENRIPFLDVLVKMNNNSFTTTVYRKPTNMGTCLNGKSQCCDQYKVSVVNNYINRAYKVTTNWSDFHNELVFIKQMLVNNDYSNSLIDNLINKFINHKITPDKQEAPKTIIPIYYNNQMHNNYKLDERIIKELINDNTQCIDQNNKINVRIYYRNLKTCNLIMKNNPGSRLQPLEQSNLVYQFICPLNHTTEEGQPTLNIQSYIGYTQCSLSKRIENHFYRGSIKEHCISSHQERPTKQFIQDNTTIISKANDKQRLLIKEALLILEKAPTINRQFDNFKHSLKLNPYRSSSHFSNNNVNASSITTDASEVLHISTSPSAPPLDLIEATPTRNTRHNNTINNIVDLNNSIFSPIVNNISPNISNRINTLISNSRRNVNFNSHAHPTVAQVRCQHTTPNRS